MPTLYLLQDSVYWRSERVSPGEGIFSGLSWLHLCFCPQVPDWLEIGKGGGPHLEVWCLWLLPSVSHLPTGLLSLFPRQWAECSKTHSSIKRVLYRLELAFPHFCYTVVPNMSQDQLRYQRRGNRLHRLMRVASKSHCQGCVSRKEWRIVANFTLDCSCFLSISSTTTPLPIFYIFKLSYSQVFVLGGYLIHSRNWLSFVIQIIHLSLSLYFLIRYLFIPHMNSCIIFNNILFLILHLPSKIFLLLIFS